MLWVPLILPGILLNKTLRARYMFERQNSRQPSTRSFRRSHQEAFIMIHVSSEGELEQVKPLLELLLTQQKRVELIFTSPSVEKKVERLYFANSELLRLLRLPLLSPFPYLFSWTTAPRVLLVRYDFYPELLLLGQKKKLMLLEATLKNKHSSGLSLHFRKMLYQLFERIVCSTQKDFERFSQIGIETSRMRLASLRLEQIYLRTSEAQQTLRRFPLFDNWPQFARAHENHELVILGNYWEEELPLLRSLCERLPTATVVIVPHLIKADSHWKDHFQGLSLPCQIYSSLEEKSEFSKNQLIVFNVKGILVELYTFFPTAYVGGGFGRSVHSLLEPFVAGASLVCGPKIHRSTEYDQVYELSSTSVLVLNNMHWPLELKLTRPEIKIRSKLVKEVADFLE